MVCKVGLHSKDNFIYQLNRMGFTSFGNRNKSHLFLIRWFTPLRLLYSKFADLRSLFQLFLGLWCVPVDLCFVDVNEITRQHLRIALKQHQKLPESYIKETFAHFYQNSVQIVLKKQENPVNFGYI